MRRIAIPGAWLPLATAAALALTSPAAQAKPPAKPAAKQGSQVAPKPAAAAAKPATPLRQDELLGRILAVIDKAMAGQPAAGAAQGPDLAEALLVGVARTSLVASLHGHFALAGLGHSLRSGAMKATDIAAMAGTMAQNYKGLAGAFALLAAQKAFDGELAVLWKSLEALAAIGQKASEALGQLAAEPADAARLAAFDAALEAYRSRLHALMQAVQGPQQP